MSQFLLLLRGGEYPESPEAIQQIIEKYVAWGQKLRSEGKYISADPLHDSGKVLRSAGTGMQITDGPFTETKEAVNGYYLLNVADADEALETAKGCPALLYGGSVELREIMQM
ncbi:MAG TPA: YciI family protein [Chthonomonadaceae bacterium]|nr:YciI family protein [Chthonomonadaceae bacterium]